MDKEKNRQSEKEILSYIVDQTENVKKREWLPADFGEREKQLRMSDEAMSELAVLIPAVAETLRLAVTAFENDDVLCAAQVEPLEQVVDVLQKQIRARHIDRLTRGTCSIELGFVLGDILTDLERISDHCSNIAGCVIETHMNAMDMHSYLSEVKSGRDAGFNERFRLFSEQYALPAQRNAETAQVEQ